MMISPETFRKAVAVGIGLVVLSLVMSVMTMCSARKQAATAHAKAREATAQANAGSAAVRAIDGQAKAQGELEAQERINQGNILNAPDAKTDAGETGNAGRSALCANERMRREHPAYCRVGL